MPHRMAARQIEWYRYSPRDVIEEFNNNQLPFNFRLQFNIKSRKNKPFEVLKAELGCTGNDTRSVKWYVLICFEADNRVAKVSLEIFRKCVPESMHGLGDLFDEWFDNERTDKSDFVAPGHFELLGDKESYKMSGIVVLTEKVLEELALKKKREREEEHREKMKSKRHRPAWLAPRRDHNGK